MNREHLEQVALINWWALEANRRGLAAELLVAVPNQGRAGGWQQARRGAYMKAEGVRKGVPDLMLLIPSQGYHGCFIELKRPEGGRVTPEQKAMMALLMGQGYVCYVAKGWDEARKFIEGYLGSRK